MILIISQYTGLELFVVFFFIATFVLMLLSMLSPPKTAQDWLRYTAIALSIVVLLMVTMGLCLYLSNQGESNDLSLLLLRAAAPLATLCGFYLVYLNFQMQQRQNAEQEIRAHVKTRIDFHLKNVELFSITLPEKGEQVKGRDGFRVFITAYIESFQSLEKDWLFIMLRAIKSNRDRNGNDCTEVNAFIERWAIHEPSELWPFCEQEFATFKNDLVHNVKLRNRTCKQTCETMPLSDQPI